MPQYQYTPIKFKPMSVLIPTVVLCGLLTQISPRGVCFFVFSLNLKGISNNSSKKTLKSPSASSIFSSFYMSFQAVNNHMLLSRGGHTSDFAAAALFSIDSSFSYNVSCALGVKSSQSSSNSS